MANAHLHDPLISVERLNDLTFKLSAKGGVAPWTWIDHPSGTVGLFIDTSTGLPTNGFYLIPGIDRSRQYSFRLLSTILNFLPIVRFQMNEALSRVKKPDAAGFVVRSLWNNTHA